MYKLLPPCAVGTTVTSILEAANTLRLFSNYKIPFNCLQQDMEMLSD